MRGIAFKRCNHGQCVCVCVHGNGLATLIIRFRFVCKPTKLRHLNHRLNDFSLFFKSFQTCVCAASVMAFVLRNWRTPPFFGHLLCPLHQTDWLTQPRFPVFYILDCFTFHPELNRNLHFHPFAMSQPDFENTNFKFVIKITFQSPQVGHQFLVHQLHCRAARTNISQSGHKRQPFVFIQHTPNQDQFKRSPWIWPFVEFFKKVWWEHNFPTGRCFSCVRWTNQANFAAIRWKKRARKGGD